MKKLLMLAIGSGNVCNCWLRRRQQQQKYVYRAGRTCAHYGRAEKQRRL